MRPGKPLTFGSYRQRPFIGLAGNPMSAFVGFHIFVSPAISKLKGTHYESKVVTATLKREMHSDGRESYIPGFLEHKDQGSYVSPVVNQSSGNLYALNTTNSLIILPVGVEFLSEGELVKVIEL